MPASFLIRRAVTDDRSLRPIAAGTEAPTFSLRSLTGETVSLEALRGRPLVVNFWGSWCKPCLQEVRMLTEAGQRHEHVAVVGILVRDDPAAALAVVQDLGAEWPTLVDPGEEVATAWGVDSAPVTFFVRRDGTVASSVVGQVHKPLIEKQLARIL